MEITERVPRDELNRLAAMSRPTGRAQPIVAGTIDDALHLATTPRRHPRPESVVAAVLPPIPPLRAPRMRAPTIGGLPTLKAAPPTIVIPPIIVEHVAPPPAPEMPPVVAMAPAVVAATVKPHRFALAAVIYALVLFALLAAF